MDNRYVIARLAVLLCVTAVIAADHEPRLGEDAFLSITGCVATSADQALCDELLNCFELFPESHQEVVHECMNQVPGGVGQCTEDKELFSSEENRKQLYHCIDDNEPKDTTEEQKDQLDKYR
ncbi:hypothetical protein NPIL_32491, partial [Nephila pilipes]